MRKKMEFAIYALAIAGPAIMGAGGVFATWNKTLGLWIGFAGAILTILALALYLQNDILKAVSQPKIDLRPPTDRFVLRWEKARYAPFTRLQDRPPDVGLGVYPTLRLVNSSPTNALDASIRWQIAPFDVVGALSQSPRFKQIKLHHQPNSVVFEGADMVLQSMNYATSLTYPINYITREVGVPVPTAVWEYAAIFVLATLPEEHGTSTAPVQFDVTVTWNIPEGGAPRHFRVKMIATNAKLPGVPEPDFLATLDFQIEDLDFPK